MINLDTMKNEKAEIMAKMSKAIADNNEEGLMGAWDEFAENIQQAVMAEAKGMISAQDSTILAGRGVRSLTSEESKYYQAVIDAMKSSNPRQALTDVSITMPLTVIEAVFEDLEAGHPLLEAVDFVNTSGMVEFLVNNGSGNLATWDTLCAEIVTEAVGGFKKIDLGHKKLSAFLPVCKAMLDLGPAWLDRYVRSILGEALYNGLEDGIISGDGLTEPVGMIRNLAAAIDPVTGYAAKVAQVVTDFDPDTYGGLAAQLAVGVNGVNRAITELILIVNPIDYLSKVMPATIRLTLDGRYIKDVFPIETTIIQSSALAAGNAVLGLPNKYFMGLGTAKSGKIEYSDEYRFLEDERVYLVKLYGNGTPKDNNAFILLDISGLVPQA